MLNWIFRTANKKSQRRAQQTRRTYQTRRLFGAERLESRELLAGDLFATSALVAAAPNAGADAPAALVGSLTAGNVGGGAVANAVANKISPTQAANIQKLVTDLQAIRATSTVTPDMVKQLVKDTAILLEGSTKPSSASVSTLITDFQNFTADGKLTVLEKAKLQKDLNQVLTEANIPKAEVAAVVDDVQVIIDASGVTASDVQTIYGDIVDIVTEAAASHSSTVNWSS